MLIAASSAVEVAYIPEATFGVTPNTGNPKMLRVTSESLTYDIAKEVSAELTSTRTSGYQIITGASTSGSLPAELQYAEHDPLIAAALTNTFTVYGTNGVGATFTADFTTTTITAAVAPTGNSAFTTLQRGQWFRVSAGANANNGKLLRVSTVTAPTSTVITLDANTPAVAGTSVANVTLQTSRLTHASLKPSFSIERRMTDVSEFFNYRGQCVDTMNISISTEAKSTIEFGFMGKDAVRATSTLLPGTAAASQTYPIHSAVSGSAAGCQIWLGSTPLTGTFATSIKLNYSNSKRAINGLCNLGAVDTGNGTIECTVDMDVLFADGTQFNQFVQNANQQIIFTSLDDSGNGYVFTIPAANMTTYATQAGGMDEEMMASMSFRALRHDAAPDAALRRCIFIDRVGAAVTP